MSQTLTPKWTIHSGGSTSIDIHSSNHLFAIEAPMGVGDQPCNDSTNGITLSKIDVAADPSSDTYNEPRPKLAPYQACISARVDGLHNPEGRGPR